MATCKADMPNATDLQPLHWQQILARCPEDAGDLPFLVYFAELIDAAEWDLDSEEMEMAMRAELIARCARVVEPVQGWDRFLEPAWGEDGGMIEEWFDEGEALQNSEVELQIEEPDRWERAMSWMRSLAVATRLIPA
jgi:hypothetical protein